MIDCYTSNLVVSPHFQSSEIDTFKGRVSTKTSARRQDESLFEGKCFTPLAIHGPKISSLHRDVKTYLSQGW